MTGPRLAEQPSYLGLHDSQEIQRMAWRRDLIRARVERTPLSDTGPDLRKTVGHLGVGYWTWTVYERVTGEIRYTGTANTQTTAWHKAHRAYERIVCGPSRYYRTVAALRHPIIRVRLRRTHRRQGLA